MHTGPPIWRPRGCAAARMRGTGKGCRRALRRSAAVDITGRPRLPFGGREGVDNLRVLVLYCKCGLYGRCRKALREAEKAGAGLLFLRSGLTTAWLVKYSVKNGHAAWVCHSPKPRIVGKQPSLSARLFSFQYIVLLDRSIAISSGCKCFGLLLSYW